MTECRCCDRTTRLMTALLVDEASVRYGDRTALDRFSVAADTGQIVAVVGPSGSGKSTLLRAIAGLEPLSGGRIVLDGRDLAGVPTHRRGLGLMFQDHGLFSHLDVAGNVAYGLRMQGEDPDVQRSRTAELLDLVGLENLGSRRADQLSGGEAQRVALARALAPRPGLLMLDEPLGSLDRALRHQLTEELRLLLSELGQTAVHVTHDQAEAFALADRVVVVADGRVLGEGAPAELWADPGSRFVAEFLGHRNLWSVDLDGDGRLRWQGASLGEVDVEHPLRRRRSPGQVVVVPITALSLRGPGCGQFSATVTEVGFRQGRYHIVAKRSQGGGPEIGVYLDAPTAPSVGETIEIGVDLGVIRPVD